MDGPITYMTFFSSEYSILLGRFGLGRKYDCIILDMQKSYMQDLVKHVDGGKIKPIIDSVFGFKEAKEAFKKLDSARARGKVFVDYSR